MPKNRSDGSSRAKRAIRKGCLLIGIALGLAVFLLLPGDWFVPARIALAWDGGVVVFLALTIWIIGAGKPADVRVRARQQDERAGVILALVVTAAVVSLVSLGFLLKKDEGLPSLLLVARMSLAGFTVVCSWLLIHTMFAIHYAHHYYDEALGTPQGPDSPDRGGLEFPGGEDPDYWDFFYFSAVIGMTSQTSDVAITSRAIRRIAAGHGLLSFVFNVVVLALTVNMLASTL